MLHTYVYRHYFIIYIVAIASYSVSLQRYVTAILENIKNWVSFDLDPVTPMHDP